MIPEYEVRVSSLIMEVTRQCNMQCAMCLRGEAQNEVMPDSVIDATFGAIDRVFSITPSGGEPFLVPNCTVKVLAAAKNRGAYSAFISTNGTVAPFSKEGLSIVREMLGFYPEKNYANQIIQVSKDSFHNDNICYYELWDVLKNVRFKSGTDAYVLNRGLAYDNGVGTKCRDEHALILDCMDDDCCDVIITVDILYVNVFGECFADCDLSYEQQDEPKDWLNEGVYLGHISNIREMLLMSAMKQFPDYFKTERVPISA